jgi:hypothetical protein
MNVCYQTVKESQSLYMRHALGILIIGRFWEKRV